MKIGSQPMGCGPIFILARFMIVFNGVTGLCKYSGLYTPISNVKTYASVRIFDRLNFPEYDSEKGVYSVGRFQNILRFLHILSFLILPKIPQI